MKKLIIFALLLVTVASSVFAEYNTKTWKIGETTWHELYDEEESYIGSEDTLDWETKYCTAVGLISRCGYTFDPDKDIHYRAFLEVDCLESPEVVELVDKCKVVIGYWEKAPAVIYWKIGSSYNYVYFRENN